MRVWGLWFRVEGLGFRIEGVGCRVQGLGLRVARARGRERKKRVEFTIMPEGPRWSMTLTVPPMSYRGTSLIRKTPSP